MHIARPTEFSFSCRQDYNHETLTGETEHGVKTTLASTDHEYKL